ncbi:MAG: glycosyltransferase [Elusimicrobia bacterium]|nr:glycosyltransferase [Elusimicrobiota bacterium]
MNTSNHHYPIKTALVYGYEPSGHLCAAKAIADFFPPSVIEPVFMNLSEIYPRLGPFVAKTYLEILHKTPAIWSYAYDNQNIAAAAKKIKTAFMPFYSQKLQNYLIKKNISAVISTHALSCMMLAKRKNELKNTPHFGVITDMNVHSYWPVEGVNLYFTPDHAIQKKGILSNNVVVSGIPVRKEFMEIIPPEKAKKAISLNPKVFTILLTGGTKGLGDIENAAKELKKYIGKIQLIVFCGGNKNLYHKLQKENTNKKNLLILNFTNSPAKYYMASDLIIGKPGGITISEALALKKPLIIFSPLPGQEERNTDFLLKNNLASYVKTPKDIEKLILKILSGEENFELYKKQADKFSKPYAAKTIASTIMDNLLRIKTD